MTIIAPPAVLYLQLRDDDGELLHGEDQTWSTERIYTHDAVYVLKPNALPDPPCAICGRPVDAASMGTATWWSSGPVFTHAVCDNLSPNQVTALKAALEKDDQHA